MKHNILLFLIISLLCQPLFARLNDQRNSVLSSGKWIKVSTTAEGIHKITYEQLKTWGIASPENVAIYSNGGYLLPEKNNIEYPDDIVKISIFHGKDANDKNSVFFYSTGNTKWNYNTRKQYYEHTFNVYSDKTYFFISSDLTKSDSPKNKTQPTIAQKNIEVFDELFCFEEENINIHKMGRIWYTDRIMRNSSQTYRVELPKVISSSKALLTISAGASSSGTSTYKIEQNNSSIGNLIFPPRSLERVSPEIYQLEYDPQSDSKLKFSYQTEASTGESWLDFFTIFAKSSLKFDGQQFTFRSAEALKHEAVNFVIENSASNLKIWEITNFQHPQNISFQKNANNISFIDSGKRINNYIIFDLTNKNIPIPEFKEEMANQNLRGLAMYEMVIVTHPSFIKPSETLAQFHREYDNMKVLVVDVNQIYNEFSSGLPDISAIRNMMRMFYKRGTENGTSLKYLLLMGDGSYDNRSLDGSKPNFLPTYQSDFLALSETFMSDDYFGLLDDNEGVLSGDLDIGIGRIPCQTVEEAEVAVNKTINYTSTETMGDWRTVLALLADDEDGNLWMSQSDELTKIIDERFPGFYYDKIFFDAYRQVSTSAGTFYPDVTTAINNRVEKGALILNYIGHANETAMAAEKVLTISDINKWGNGNKLPIFVTATCEFSRFDDDKMSAGESILFNAAGGGVALFTTTRKVYGGENFDLNKSFYRHVFEHDKNGNNLRMGDVLLLAKNNISEGLNKRNFVLLGDPALRLAFPQLKVVTTSINGHQIGDSISLGALEQVNVEGEIHKPEGIKADNINGEVNITVFDKSMKTKTLSNDGGRAFEYKVQNNIIYKGTASVTNGNFNFSFIVPKDITYNIGEGRILYYFSNDSIDGNGSISDFLIGGSSNNPINESTGPDIKLYLNNYKFKSNDKVSSSALLLVNLFDESGINTAGTGIGHDITAVIDDEFSNVIVLNDFYSSDLDTYKSGKIIFPLNNLTAGKHKIMVKAWDIQNNSSFKEISFIVEEGFQITAVNNAPNPVDFYTNFNISHNLPGNRFNIKLEIFNIRGYLVHESTETVGTYGSTTATIRWDVTDTRYHIGNDRLLIYRITMENPDGLSASGSGKLILNKF
ncbi:MAG TPA: type IX secretion system sortase PorU [Prolixibacteraceae bacterium]|nr:type IX secretion system sortase PorU [Prolixibacteraceae bacterium]